jgi:hypothetical protein
MRERNSIKFAAPVNPFILNDRLTFQKGLFLCPGDPTKSFMENLQALKGGDDNCKKLMLFQTDQRTPVSLSAFKEQRRTALDRLYHMNISHDTLFPGLEGFARSLEVYHPVAWKM